MVEPLTSEESKIRSHVPGGRVASTSHQLPTEPKLLISLDYLIATKRLTTRRIGTRVFIPIEDVRRFARSDHLERLAG
jgi:hypothetical protein